MDFLTLKIHSFNFLQENPLIADFIEFFAQK